MTVIFGLTQQMSTEQVSMRAVECYPTITISAIRHRSMSPLLPCTTQETHSFPHSGDSFQHINLLEAVKGYSFVL